MMRIEPEYGGCSVVLIGHFNPSIFTPDWFVRNEIATQEEYSDGKVNIIHPEISSFSLSSKIIQVDVGRFSVETSEAPWVLICDFVVRTFGEFLSHTPINRIGVNRMVHFRLPSEEIRNSIGRKLAPLEPWGEWGREIELAPASKRGGFVSLTMQQSNPDSRYGGHIQANIQPSQRITDGTGIFVVLNDDYIIAENQAFEARKAMEILYENFDTSLSRSEKIIDQLMSLKDN